MTPELRTLLAMLTYCRPAGSPTEREFIARWISTLPGVYQDVYRNYHVRIGSPRILWSCHTDTVHWVDGRQTIAHNAASSVVQLSKRSIQAKRNCLGADDTAGVWLCYQMIQRGIPGHYIFHYGEEQGCMGSRDLAMFGPELIADSEIALALDRRGPGDIITSQFGQRCASDVFADSLALELGKSELNYQATAGIYTDTAEYTELIPECSNLSVGYGGEHSSAEFLHTRHVQRLLDGLCQLDQSALVVGRSLLDTDEDDWHYLRDWDTPVDTLVIDMADGRAINHSDCDLCGGLMVDDVCHDCGNVEQSFYLDRAQAEIQAACRRQSRILPYRVRN